MFVAVVAGISRLVLAAAVSDVDQGTVFAVRIRRALAVFSGVGDRVAGRLKPRLDFAEHRQDIGRVWFLCDDGLTFLQGHAVGTGVVIGLGEAAANAPEFVGFTDLLVSFL